jgi:hypothetical protein
VGLKVLKILHRSLYKTILGHIQVGINFHGGPDTGVTDGFGEGSKIEVGIIFMLNVVMGHIGVPKAVHSNIVG